MKTIVVSASIKGATQPSSIEFTTCSNGPTQGYTVQIMVYGTLGLVTSIIVPVAELKDVADLLYENAFRNGL